MSSASPTKRLTPANFSPSGKGIWDWLRPFFTSSIGAKATTAVTGMALTGFVIAHLVGNLKIFAGRDALNEYAAFLQSFGPLLWVARIGLLVVFVLHLYLALSLKRRSVLARPVKYQFERTIQAPVSSKIMPWTGAVILLFVLFHLAHFTFGWVSTTMATEKTSLKLVEANYLEITDQSGLRDVYTMVIHGFSNPVIAILYLVAQVFLFLHLQHGIASVFQTLGLNTPRIQPTIRKIALGIAGLILLGNSAIVVAVWTGQMEEYGKGVYVHKPETVQMISVPSKN
ncbi:MAG: succinate dehydrogenase cytochrome b subunit [Zavarzinella sp.]